MTLIVSRASRGVGFALAEQAAVPVELPGIGRWDPDSLQLFVVDDAEALRTVSRGRAPSWGVGFALPATGTIMIRADAIDPAGALRHELAHLGLHSRIASRVPLWFDEGYAVVAANEFGRMLTLQLNLAVAIRGVGGLRELDRALRAGPGEAEAAYALAGSAVAHVLLLQPSASLDKLIGRLEAGEGFDTALLSTTGYDLPAFERSWRRQVRRRYGLFVWLMAGGWWALAGFGLVGFAALKRRRDAPRRAALDEGWPLPDTEEMDMLDRSSTTP